MTRSDRWIEPLADEDAAASEALDLRHGRLDLRFHLFDDRLRPPLRAQASPKLEDALLDLRDRVRVERERFDADGAEPIIPARDSTDLAEILSEDQIGRQPGDLLGVDGIEGADVGERSPDRGVDRGAVEFGAVDSRSRNNRQARNRRREVTLRRTADEQIELTKRGDDLGCTR